MCTTGVACGGAPSIARRWALWRSSVKTRAAPLAVEGLHNGQIAQRLVLSVRTVDHHVEAVYRKLGVSTRVTMSQRAVELGLVGTPN